MTDKFAAEAAAHLPCPQYAVRQDKSMTHQGGVHVSVSTLGGAVANDMTQMGTVGYGFDLDSILVRDIGSVLERDSGQRVVFRRMLRVV
jgi:hypothetical protein